VDQTTYLLLLALAVIVALAAVGVMRAHPTTPTTPDGSDSTLGVSTEGEKVCPKCGMGNLWTDRSCIACRTPLRG
jgi:hypothetical protein